MNLTFIKSIIKNVFKSIFTKNISIKQINNLDIPQECIETFEDIKQQLEAVELKLAKRFNILTTKSSEHIRSTLIKMSRANELVEDELVRDWHDLYASYQDWIKYDHRQ